ncbi:MAG: hypothetical protein QM710_05665 [Flavobacterium sp.]
MKKIIAALTLLFAFSINAHAQDKGYVGLTNGEKAKKQAAEISEYLGLDQTMQTNFVALFEYKIEVLNDKNATAERKAEMSKVVEAKIRGTLDGNQMDKLEKNPELLKRLIN